jgi:hypothetical protein
MIERQSKSKPSCVGKQAFGRQAEGKQAGSAGKSERAPTVLYRQR